MKKRITKHGAEVIKVDNQFQTHTITAVDDYGKGEYTLKFDGACFGVNSPDFEPKVGMTVKTYGKGFGYSIRGVVINDTIIYYNTEEEAKANFDKYLKDEKAKKIKNYNKNIKKIEAEYNALPEIFRKRIDKFRKANEDFKYEYEGYEMFCCKEAVKIAKALKTVEAIDLWKDAPYEKQKTVVDIDDGHSGNTFGCACGLAKLYIQSPEYVLLAHGALTPLVGCEAYGCEHKG